MVSSTLLCIAAILGSSIFKAYTKDNSGKKEPEETNTPANESIELHQDNVSDYSLEKFEITLSEKILYDSLREQLDNLKDVKDNGDVDDKLCEFKNITFDIGTYYLNAPFQLPNINRPLSVKIMTVLESRFKGYIKDKNLSILFDQVKFYIEFCLREIEDSENDKLFHYLLDYSNEGKICNEDNGDSEIMEKYINDFEEIFIPIIFSKENKKENNALEQKYKDPQISEDKIISSYFQLLSYSGILYNELKHVYKKYGIYIGNDNYDHDVVYEISKTILTISDFYFTHGMSVSNLAHDITNHNINHLHHNQPDANDGDTEKMFMSRLIKNYFENRTIKNYYYFLIMCSRAYHSLKKNWKGDRKKLFTHISDEHQFEREAIDLVYKSVKDMDYPFLEGLDESDIKQHILKTDIEPYEFKKA